MYKILSIYFTLLLSIDILINYNQCDYLSLTGYDWHTYNQNKSIKINAKVPGSIYTDLRAGKVIPDNLYYTDRDVKLRWISYDNWTYERTFNVESSLLNKQNVYLVANGVDTVSTVHLNDHLIGQTDNQFVRYKFDVRTLLRSGQNTLRLDFKSAPLYARQQYFDFKHKYNYSVGHDDFDPGAQHGEGWVQFIRKMQASFSWDWGPAFPTQGIWKPIGIESYDGAVIRDITVETTANRKTIPVEWTLTVNAFIESSANRQLDAVFDIRLDNNLLVAKLLKKLKTDTKGEAKAVFVIPIPQNMSIEQWFPNGVADNTQKLYDLTVNLLVPEVNEVSSTETRQIGFRTIELIQTPIKPEGLTFYFRINGVPFFAKGTNWIPANNFMENLTESYLRHLLLSAKQANMNMMRVWGGGVYESDLFYRLADEYGIMIWQDFMFACNIYPPNPEFLESVHWEVVQNVRRLQHHPSIALWAGNNENEYGLAGGWWPRAPQLLDDYRKLYVQTIGKVLAAEDPHMPYVTSSPSNGLMSIAENYTAKDPSDNRYGDIHYYNDGSELWNWRSLQSPKFASEYGYQSYPSVDTLSLAFPDTDLIYPLTADIQHHQHKGSYMDDIIKKQIGFYLRVPSAGGIDRLNDFIYSSQIIQAMAMKTETEFYRRNRQIDPTNGKGFTMGALYWQLNDIWPAPTWASIESTGKWKVLHSYAIKFLANHLLVPYEDTDQLLRVPFVRDDYLGQLAFNYSINVYNWSRNKPVHTISGNFTSDSFSVTEIFNQSIPKLLAESKCDSRSDCILSIDVQNSDHNIQTNNFMLLTKPNEAKLVKPNLRVIDVQKRPARADKYVFDIHISADSVAPFVVLDLKPKSGIIGQFLDNGFFIFDGNFTATFQTDTDIGEQQIRDNLIVKTLTDVK